MAFKTLRREHLLWATNGIRLHIQKWLTGVNCYTANGMQVLSTPYIKQHSCNGRFASRASRHLLSFILLGIYMPVALCKRNFWAYIYAFRSTRVKHVSKGSVCFVKGKLASADNYLAMADRVFRSIEDHCGTMKEVITKYSDRFTVISRDCVVTYFPDG